MCYDVKWIGDLWDFKTGAFNHSAISPLETFYNQILLTQQYNRQVAQLMDYSFNL